MQKLQPFSLRPWLVLLALVVLLAGCLDEDSEESGSTSATEAGTLERLFTYSAIKGCSSCHAPGANEANGPDLSSQSSFKAALVSKNKDSYSSWFTTNDCATSSDYWVVPNSPNLSYLMDALITTDSRCSGTSSYHDTQNVSISAELKEDLRLWIENGAN